VKQVQTAEVGQRTAVSSKCFQLYYTRSDRHFATVLPPYPFHLFPRLLWRFPSSQLFCVHYKNRCRPLKCEWRLLRKRGQVLATTDCLWNDAYSKDYPHVCIHIQSYAGCVEYFWHALTEVEGVSGPKDSLLSPLKVTRLFTAINKVLAQLSWCCCVICSIAIKWSDGIHQRGGRCDISPNRLWLRVSISLLCLSVIFRIIA
jgi:hypothetical protein